MYYVKKQLLFLTYNTLFTYLDLAFCFKGFSDFFQGENSPLQFKNSIRRQTD